jgi:hypothetical protein
VADAEESGRSYRLHGPRRAAPTSPWPQGELEGCPEDGKRSEAGKITSNHINKTDADHLITGLAQPTAWDQPNVPHGLYSQSLLLMENYYLPVQG